MAYLRLAMLAIGVAALAISCGGSEKPPPTPTATSTPRPPATATIVPASAGILDSWRTYVLILYGCECLGPPAAGIVSITIVPPDDRQAYTPLSTRIDQQLASHPIDIPLAWDDQISAGCSPATDGTYAAFTGSYGVPPDEVVPGSGGLRLQVLVRHGTDELWVEAVPTEVCTAIS